MQRVTRDHLVPPGADRWRPRPPAACVELGEKVIVETVNFRTPIIRSQANVTPAAFFEREETGPIFFNGLRPGDTLAITLHDILPEGQASGAELKGTTTGSYLPIESNRVCFPGGLRAPRHMMIGEIYVVPAALPPSNPHDCGGNLYFKDVCAGNTLLLKVHHEGGLLVLGDAHACQGDGEIAGCGAECAAEVTLSARREDRLHSERPVILKERSFVCIAARSDYWQAVKLACDDAAKLLSAFKGCSYEQAHLYVNTVGDLRNGGIYPLGYDDPARRRGDPPRVGIEVPWPD